MSSTGGVGHGNVDWNQNPEGAFEKANTNKTADAEGSQFLTMAEASTMGMTSQEYRQFSGLDGKSGMTLAELKTLFTFKRNTKSSVSGSSGGGGGGEGEGEGEGDGVNAPRRNARKVIASYDGQGGGGNERDGNLNSSEAGLAGISSADFSEADMNDDGHLDSDELRDLFARKPSVAHNALNRHTVVLDPRPLASDTMATYGGDDKMMDSAELSRAGIELSSDDWKYAKGEDDDGGKFTETELRDLFAERMKNGKDPLTGDSVSGGGVIGGGSAFGGEVTEDAKASASAALAEHDTAGIDGEGSSDGNLNPSEASAAGITSEEYQKYAGGDGLDADELAQIFQARIDKEMAELSAIGTDTSEIGRDDRVYASTAANDNLSWHDSDKDGKLNQSEAAAAGISSHEFTMYKNGDEFLDRNELTAIHRRRRRSDWVSGRTSAYGIASGSNSTISVSDAIASGLPPGEARAADADGNGMITEAEARNYFATLYDKYVNPSGKADPEEAEKSVPGIDSSERGRRDKVYASIAASDNIQWHDSDRNDKLDQSEAAAAGISSFEFETFKGGDEFLDRSELAKIHRRRQRSDWVTQETRAYGIDYGSNATISVSDAITRGMPPAVASAIDTDGNGTITEAEARNYFDKMYDKYINPLES